MGAVSASVTKARPAAASTSVARSWRLTFGMDIAGKPAGTSPITLTPCCARPNATTATREPTTTNATPGNLGNQWRSATISTTETRPIAVDGPPASPWYTPRINDQSSRGTEPPAVAKPNNFGSWPQMMMIATPFRYPIRTGLESNSATVPSLAMPAARQMRPISTASVLASAIARAGSGLVASSGAMTVKIIGPSVESGPTTRMREGPNSAYANNPAAVVYKPTAGGSPASPA